jgi:hypothetical protein
VVFKKYKVEIFIENKDEHRVYIAKVTQRVKELSFESFDFGVQLTFNRGENSDFDLINHIPYNIIKYAVKLTQHIQKRYLIK